MKAPNQKPHLFDSPRNVSRLLNTLYLACVSLVLLDFVLHRHVTHQWEAVTGFYAVFGFVACVSLVLIAKQLRRILQRREDYYDVDD
jgi:hypothetical protein